MHSKFMPLLSPFTNEANGNDNFADRWLMMDDADRQSWSLMANIEEMLGRDSKKKEAKKNERRKRSASSLGSSVESLFASSSSSSLENLDNSSGTTDSAWSHLSFAHNVSHINESRDGDFKSSVNKQKGSSSSSSSSPLSSTRMPSKAEHFRKSSSSSGSGSGKSHQGLGGNGSGNSGNGDGHHHNGNSNGGKGGGSYWRDMDSLHYTESEPYGIKAVHPRTHWIDDQARHHDRHVVVDPKKTTCMLYLQADHLFFEKMGSEEACIESMTRHVQKVNNIYKNTGKCSSDDGYKLSLEKRTRKLNE